MSYPLDTPESQPPEPQVHEGKKPVRPDWLVGSEDGLDARSLGIHEYTPGDPTLLRRLAPELPPKPAAPPPNTGPPAPEPPPVAKAPAVEPHPAAKTPAAEPKPSAKAPAEAAPPDPSIEAISAYDYLEASCTNGGATPEPLQAAYAPQLKWYETDSGSQSGKPAAGGDRPEPSRSAIESLIALALDRRVQVVVAIAAIFVLTIQTRAWMEPGLLVSRIRRHPERFDGQIVTVRGRVGEVFPVGGSYAFNLTQGRDTLVVFSRSRIPLLSQVITVTGSVSTGYLEGAARAAVFEQGR